ncbi:class I SAM-dependent methyltransferase [Paenibacillus sp. FSL R7-0331]|uniref:class I SAM-dependent methyltransferase n=1 Tax=Paenibacillus sp. FSL R7-0331 TaxID=1536773 RepID=UPI0004F8B949|nr:class I SAM-dependent methyltransferase [Paenibacillus sp. FSL R7-0331]AIQ50262.1 hypothetical protein R70331_01000 [Paenibacillus sp. FSL R7-0331]
MKDGKNVTANPWEQADPDRYTRNISRKIPGYQLQYELIDKLLTALLDKQERPELLVVGAGGGQEIITLGASHPDWRFCGLDTSAGMLEAAGQRIAAAGLTDRVQLHHADLCSWSSGGQYDAATCMLVLHFVQGRESKLALLKAIAARLKPGAPLFISAINGDPASQAWQLQMAGWKVHMLQGGVELGDWEQFAASFGVTSHPLQAAEMELLLKQAGFTQLSGFFGSFLINGWTAVRQP